MIQLASAAAGNTEILHHSDLKGYLGHDGIFATPQCCSTSGDAQVEVKDNSLTNTIHINVLSPGSGSQSDETDISAPASPSLESLDSSKKGAKVSRSINDSILYRKHRYFDTVARNPGLQNNEISKIIGKMWRDESETVKKQWKDQAESVKRQHLRDHPDYQYQPRKPHEKKRRMTKRKAMALAAQQVAPSSSASVSTAVPNFAPNAAGAVNIFSPGPSTVGPFSSITSPSQLVDLGNFDDPSLGYSSNGDLASFTLDTFESNQLDLFSNLLDEHNLDFEYADDTINGPAASTSLPTTLNHSMADGNNGASLIDPNLTANDLAMAETDLNNFESSLEDMLSRELENMDEGAASDGFQYNDLESQRFTEFLEQMPEHMWGMEFVN